ncbi:hypothetical protein B5M09_004992 [Aphanomyces astaci]|uniref:EF-hand domain-containing protein n=1 Tax=Aphanomyces astaci TaxID=112090 RepID=A0A425CCL9_APHAT|nr:hypothetical protein B5M09_004992 [Aphanomyces astaci]
MLKTLVKRALRKDSSGDEQGTNRPAAIIVKNKSSKKNKQSRVLDTAVFHAITKAVVERRKVSSTELCQTFEKLDEHEVGLLTEASFTKGLVKIGIKLKPDQVESLADCFRREVKQKKNAPDIDYYAFVDFAIQERDTDVLVAVGDKLRRAIASFDKKADDRQPWNAMDELRRLDKKERGRISPDAFRTFLESNRSIEFELSMKQVSAVTERFEFEDDKGTSGVDYEQFATWLQPSLHVDVAQLHVHIKRLFAKAQAECNLSLKTIFEEIDDDDSGHVTASELKEALRNLGLPITDTQIKCLVDEYDVNGDGKIDYSEFTSAFAAKRSTSGNVNDSDDNDNSSNHDMNKKKKQPKQRDDARRPLIPVATQTAIEKAVVRKDGHRLSGKVLCAVFEQSDTHELGHLDDATFAKCVGKLGLKLKSAQMKQVVECFRVRPNQKSKTKDVVDYYGFVDYAINITDTDKLTAIGDKMRRAISRHDKNAKHDNEPFNLGGALRKLDKKERQWLSSDVVRGYLESSHGSVDFELTSKEVALLVGRFEFEFDSAKASNLAVDYEQLATWVQPALNVNVKQLHTRVSMLLQKAKNEHQLSLKNVFDAIDDDRSGSINRSEFKQALHVMGLPLTEAQAYCLVDEYDTSGDGRIQYSEFASAFGSKATSSSKDESEDDNTKKDAPKTKATRLVPVAAEEAIATAVRGKRKLSPADLCHAFEKYDKGDHGGGLIDEATFTKVVGKSLGIKLKSEHLKVLVECFRKGKSFKSSKSKTTADIDYVGFVDFATNIPDTAKVAAIGDKMRRAIKQYDASSTDRQPFNVLEDLQSLDKRDTGRLKPNVFREYVESNPRIEFGLTEQEATRLTERFEFEYADKSAGVDYDQVAKWLQPSLHYNTNDLHKHVSKLFAKAKKDGHMLSLKAIFEDIDDDGSGHVTRMELGDALSGMGLPLTSGQIKCLVDEYDLNGDGKIQYDEFAKAFSKPVDGSDGSGDSSSDEATRRKQKNHPVKSPRPSKSKPKTTRTTLLTSATLDAIAHAVRGKRKISATELCAVFEKYDTDESGLLDPPEFTKCVAKKLGIKLQKDQLNAVIDCFRKDGRVDYYGFADFAVSTPDSDKLCAVGDKMRLAIDTYNNQNSDSKQPFNMMHELRKLDKNDRWRLKPRVFRGYLKSNKTVTFNLTDKEVELVASHFEFEYAHDDDVGVDYEHFAKWVQPQLHVNVADLHMHVKALFHKAKKQCNLSLKQIFEDIDDDDSGYITRNEFQTALRGLSLPLTDTQIRCLVDEYDMNGDDRIEYAEFAQAFAVAPDTDESDAKS